MRAKKTLYIQTKYGRHLSLLEPDERKGFIVTAPGLPGVITWGKNLAHAKAMGKEAIELCIECLVEGSLRRKPRLRARATAGVSA